MHIVFLGAPGSGKGTHARILEKKLKAVYISTGDILRDAIKEQTPLGLEADKRINDGFLVPDNLILDLIREKFINSNSENWITDGFPRTVIQAECFDKLLCEISQEIDCVIEMDVSKESIVKRLTGRRLCKTCQAPYHIIFNPYNENGTCKVCGSNNIYQRDDDKEEIVLNRLKIYEEQTLPLVNYYKSKVKFFTISVKVDGKIEETSSRIIELLGL